MLQRICESDRRTHSVYTRFLHTFHHISCRNLTRVLSMSNNFKELLKSSTSLLVVYSMLVAFAKAVGDVK